jgi:hypothetical protein
VLCNPVVDDRVDALRERIDLHPARDDVHRLRRAHQRLVHAPDILAVHAHERVRELLQRGVVVRRALDEAADGRRDGRAVGGFALNLAEGGPRALELYGVWGGFERGDG